MAIDGYWFDYNGRAIELSPAIAFCGIDGYSDQGPIDHDDNVTV